MNPALTNLHPFLRTKNDANNLNLLLGNLVDEIYKESFNLHDMLLKRTSYEMANAIEKTAPAQTDKKTLQSFLLHLQEEITTIPTIHIILPFAPKEQLVDEMHDWFYRNYHKTVILDISVDNSLIGGAVISFQGRANDYTLKNAIDQLT